MSVIRELKDLLFKRFESDRAFINQSDKFKGFEYYIRKNPVLKFIFEGIIPFFILILRKLQVSRNCQSSGIAVISCHRLGDTVFTIPAIRQVLEYYKYCQVTIFTFEETKSIYEEILENVNYHIINKEDLKIGRRIVPASTRKALRKLNPGTIIDLSGGVFSASLIFRAKSPVVIGLSGKYFKNFYSHTVAKRDDPHCMDIYMDIINLIIPINNREKLYKFETRVDRSGYVLIHPFGIRRAKEWNLEKYIKLADELNKSVRVMLVFPDNTMPEEMMKEIKDLEIPYRVTRSMNELISVIRKCSVYISNDSGPLYIASLLGKPTFTIYGPTNPAYSMPFGSRHRIIRKVIACSPLKNQFCDTFAGIHCNTFDCMNMLPYEEVRKEVVLFLKDLQIEEKSVV